MNGSRGATKPDRSAEAVAEVSATLERVMSWLRRATPPMEWSAVALSTLDRLARLGPQRISDLVTQERITQPGMTGLVSRLAAAGLVARKADPSDGRAALVSITGEGHDYLRQVHEIRASTVATHIRRLPPGQQRALLSAVDALDNLATEPVDTGADLT